MAIKGYTTTFTEPRTGVTYKGAFLAVSSITWDRRREGVSLRLEAFADEGHFDDVDREPLWSDERGFSGADYAAFVKSVEAGGFDAFSQLAQSKDPLLDAATPVDA